MAGQNDVSAKIQKKQIKAAAKDRKAKAKRRGVPAFLKTQLPDGVALHLHRGERGAELLVRGLSEQQLQRIVPQLQREVLISVVQDDHSLQAAVMRFMREGLFQTIVKVIAGVIVGFVLLQLGMN